MADGRRVLLPAVHVYCDVRERGQGPGRALPGPADFGRRGNVPAGDPAVLLLVCLSVPTGHARDQGAARVDRRILGARVCGRHVVPRFLHPVRRVPGAGAAPAAGAK